MGFIISIPANIGFKRESQKLYVMQFNFYANSNINVLSENVDDVKLLLSYSSFIQSMLFRIK